MDRERNLWTVELLNIQSGNRVWEIGCGPGLALEAYARRLVTGRVTGLDHSETMLRQAGKRNQRGIDEGRVSLRLGGSEGLERLEGPFDEVFSVNVVRFLPDNSGVFRAVHGLLAPGGITATTYQPRHRKPTRADALRMAEDIVEAVKPAGYTAMRVEELPLQPVPAVCVLGVLPEGRVAPSL
jgi:cyclopropane fatty-acyl-phospholipid synthase-like methyltransferase